MAQCHRKWLGDIRDIGDTVSPVGILRSNETFINIDLFASKEINKSKSIIIHNIIIS